MNIPSIGDRLCVSRRRQPGTLLLQGAHGCGDNAETKIMRPFFAVCLTVLMIVCAAQAQDSRPAFGVASVKFNKSGERASSTVFPPGGRFSAKNSSLKLLIRLAYGVADYQIAGGPDWIRFDHFDVEAKSEANPTLDELKLMLQQLLGERFQLNVHRATKEDAVYALVVSKGGPKFKRVQEEDSERLRNDAWHGVKAAQGHLFTQKGEMAGLAAFLTQMLDRPVIDKTNLDGFFEFDFAVPATILPSPDSAESIFEAIQDQLGLRLEQTKGPIEVLVIDRVERLTEN
jgi:uncharacterized protein (TIGR03435 family)